MYVSIRDNMLTSSGFSDIVEGLRFYGLDAVEIAVRRDFRIPALTPTAERPHLYLNDDADVERLREQAAETRIRIPAFLLGNDFNAEDIDTELAWMTRVVEVAGRLGIPAVRIDAVMRGEHDLPLEERHTIFARGVRMFWTRQMALRWISVSRTTAFRATTRRFWKACWKRSVHRALD
jgi:sugar phosphate isomerase/epimerase